jgi:serine phosphatase RsbU (regulator of sigma subunit)
VNDAGRGNDDWNSGKTTLVVAPQQGREQLLEERVSYLVVIEGLDRGHVYPIGDRPITFGRMAPADIVLQDAEVSRRHCTVELELGEVRVTDLGSTNGTFVDGARVSGSATLPEGGYLQVGAHVLKYERRGVREMEQTQQLDRSLERASQYIRSLLPAPLTQGPIRTEWLLLPSARLGGDAFGYRALDDDRFAMYLLDVSGHGPDAAMLAVAVMNVLRQGTLPKEEFADPARLVTKLNEMFQMEEHGSMFFTIWYGIFSRSSRTLSFCSAGHHPAYLVPHGRKYAQPLRTPNLVVGMLPETTFVADTVHVEPRSTLYIFSDGVFEIVTPEGRRWELDDFVPLLNAPMVPGLRESERLHQGVQRAARRGPFDDDFSLLVVAFD